MVAASISIIFAICRGVPLAGQNFWGCVVGPNEVFLYPLFVVYVVSPLTFGICHALLLATGTFLLAQRWIRSPGQSGLLAVGSAAIVFWLPLNAVAATAWIPLIVWFSERASVCDRRALIPLACALSAQMLTGCLEVILFTWLLLMLSQARGFASTRLAAALLIAFGLCATQVVPFMI